MLQVAGRAGLEQVSWLVTGRFAFAAAAASVGLLNDPTRPHAEDALWTSSGSWWIADVAAVVVLALLLVGTTRWAAARSIRRPNRR
jgi:predicted cobalt transporter CbtA